MRERYIEVLLYFLLSVKKNWSSRGAYRAGVVDGSFQILGKALEKTFYLSIFVKSSLFSASKSEIFNFNVSN